MARARPQGGATPTATGAWEVPDSYVYFMDRGLVAALGVLMAGGSVIELGAGKGCYTAALRRRGVAASAYDGGPNIAQLTGGLVQRADLTKELGLAPADWVLCLETAEHIPHQFEGVLLRNMLGAARVGVVLSWSNNEGGNGHVNLRTNEWVVARMASLGFAHDAAAQRDLRRSISHIHWFRETLMAFRRSGSSAKRT